MKTKYKWIIGISAGIILLVGILWLFSDSGLLSQISPSMDSVSSSGGGGSP